MYEASSPADEWGTHANDHGHKFEAGSGSQTGPCTSALDEEGEGEGIIEPVPINTPTSWCTRMLIVPKSSGEPRRTVDFKALNDASVRQTHHTKSPFALASEVPRGTVKSVLDVWNAYHSVPIRTEDKDKSTFITPWGRFRYLRAP